MNSKIHRISEKGKWTVINSNCDYSNNIRLNFKTRIVWEETKYVTISEMLFAEQAQVFCATDSFPSTFTHFQLMIFTQERISAYVYPCP